MSQPTYQIIVYFGTTSTASTIFTLDDPTRGLLDSIYVLNGDTGTDVAGYAVTVKSNRGRTSQLFDNIDAGTVTVELNNESRLFDPFYAAGSLYGKLVPGKRVTILADGVVIFDGRISDWNLAYDVSGRSVASFTAEDSLATLGRKQFDAWTATASQTAGPRLTAILNRAEVGWPGGQRDIDTGVSTLQGDPVSYGSSVLNYCQLVARSDGPSAFFASRDGLLTFRDRRANLAGASLVTFADDGTGAVFQGVSIAVGSETFYTRVAIDREGGIVQSYTTTTATTDDVISLTITGLLLNSDTQSLDMATYYANVFATGEARISEVTTTIDTGLVSMANRLAILALDINDLITVKYTPNRVGAQVEQRAVVLGVRHFAVPGRHDVSLTLGKYDDRAPFILDSSTSGVLDGPGVLIY